MTNSFFRIGDKIKSNTYYKFDKSNCDIHIEDTVSVKDRKYLSLTIESNITELNVAFFIKDIKDTVLDFNGAVLTLHGKIQPFIFENCENITVKNVSIIYERAFYSEFDIIENLGNKLRVVPKKGFECQVKNGYLIPYCNEWESNSLHQYFMFCHAFDSKSCEPKGTLIVKIGEEISEQKDYPFKYKHVKVEKDQDDILLYSDFPKEWKEGTTLAVVHEPRDYSSIELSYCKNILIEDYRIVNGSGWGVLGMYSENIMIDGLKLKNDSLSNGVITNAADGVHLISTKGKVTIKNSIFENMSDDAINIHTNFFTAIKTDKNIIYVAKDERDGLFDAYFPRLGTGDLIAVYNGKSLEKKSEFKILNISIIDTYNMIIEADRNVEDIKAGDMIENLSVQPDIIIEKCVFGKADSHLRLQSRGNVKVRDCVIGLPILLSCDMNYFFEASPINDLTIENCEFVGNRGVVNILSECYPNKIMPYCHSNIKILNCSFDAKIPVVAEAAKDIIFKGNKGTDMILKLTDCFNVETDENVNIIFR